MCICYKGSIQHTIKHRSDHWEFSEVLHLGPIVNSFFLCAVYHWHGLLNLSQVRWFLCRDEYFVFTHCVTFSRKQSSLTLFLPITIREEKNSKYFKLNSDTRKTSLLNDTWFRSISITFQLIFLVSIIIISES